MNRKAFLASIVSLGALALKPAAFVTALRKLLTPMGHLKIGDTVTVRRPIRFVVSQNRIDFLDGFKFESDQFVPCTLATPAEVAEWTRNVGHFDPTQVRITA